MKSTLTSNGFCNNILIHDNEDPTLQLASLLLGRTDATTESREHGGEIILIERHNPSQTARDVSARLTHELEKASCKVQSFTWGSDISKIAKKTCISLLELENPFLSNLTEQHFTWLKEVILETAGIFWVAVNEDPNSAMISGLARVVRNEAPGLSFRTLHTDSVAVTSPERLATLLGRAFLSAGPEDEYLIKDGTILVSRIEEDTTLNNQLEDLLPSSGRKVAQIALGQALGPLKLCIQTPGMLDSLCFEPDDLPNTELKSDEIEIQVKATALK